MSEKTNNKNTVRLKGMVVIVWTRSRVLFWQLDLAYQGNFCLNYPWYLLPGCYFPLILLLVYTLHKMLRKYFTFTQVQNGKIHLLYPKFLAQTQIVTYKLILCMNFIILALCMFCLDLDSDFPFCLKLLCTVYFTHPY